jgi:hypothetical protein
LSFCIPATHLNPHVSGFFIVKYSGTTEIFLLSSSQAFFIDFSGVSLDVFFVSRLFPISIACGVQNVVSKAFVISHAFATDASIFLRTSHNSHFQSFLMTLLNSFEVVTASKNASNQVSF